MLHVVVIDTHDRRDASWNLLEMVGEFGDYVLVAAGCGFLTCGTEMFDMTL